MFLWLLTKFDITKISEGGLFSKDSNCNLSSTPSYWLAKDLTDSISLLIDSQPLIYYMTVL